MPQSTRENPGARPREPGEDPQGPSWTYASLRWLSIASSISWTSPFSSNSTAAPGFACVIADSASQTANPNPQTPNAKPQGPRPPTPNKKTPAPGKFQSRGTQTGPCCTYVELPVPAPGTLPPPGRPRDRPPVTPPGPVPRQRHPASGKIQSCATSTQGTPRIRKEPQGSPGNPKAPRGTPRNPNEPQGTPRNPRR